LTEIEGASPALLQELQRAALIGKLAATFVEGKPVSFCDAATETETLWDIGIETLEPYRGRGYAALCVAYVIDQMGRRGKRPVWGAEESNSASMNLAAKLGFRAVDRLTVLYPPSEG
jgi:predicted GNAT family acetyltransferase